MGVDADKLTAAAVILQNADLKVDKLTMVAVILPKPIDPDDGQGVLGIVGEPGFFSKTFS